MSKGTYYREFQMQPGTREAVIATENPVPVFDFERGEVVPEILLASGMHVRGGGDQIPLLDTHDRTSIFSQLGSLRGVRAENGEITGEPHFDKTEEGQKAKTKVDGGHVNRMSAGYRISPDKSRYVGEGESAEISGRTFDGPAVIRTEWEIFEGSLVPVPADTQAKMRGYLSVEDARAKISRQRKDGKSTPAGRESGDGNGEGSPQPDGETGETRTTEPKANQTRTMDPETITPAPEAPAYTEADREKDTRAAKKAELDRIRQITEFGNELGDKHNNTEHFSNWARQCIDDDTPISEARAAYQAMKQWESKPLNADDPDAHRIENMSEKDAQQYSLVRAINILADGGEVDGLEGEASDEIAKRTKRDPQGFFVPIGNLSLHAAMAAQQRGFGYVPGIKGDPRNTGYRTDLDSTTATTAAELVGVAHRPQDLIEVLRNRQVAVQAGARSLNIDSGTISIPRVDTAGSFGWVTENPGGSNLTETNVVTGAVTATGNEGGASHTYSKKLLRQGTPSVENLVRDDLTQSIAVGKDLAFFEGSGSSGQPTGIKNTGSIGGVTFGVATTPTWAEMVEFQTDVASGNAEMGSLSYVFNAAVRGNLMTLPKDASNGGEGYIIDSNNMIGGRPYFLTEQISSNFVAYGNWSDTFIVDWGGIDIVVNPYTDDLARQIRVSAFIITDVAVRHAASYSWSSNAAA